MHRYILGIDIGTGSVKSVAVNLEGKPIGISQIHYPAFSSQKGYYEQNPEQIFQAFTTCINNLINQLGSAPIAVSLSSAMHSVLAMNKNGIAISPLITWADSRSGNTAKEIRNQPEGEQIYNKTGTPIYSMSPLTKIKWLKEHDALLFSKTEKFISIKEYIWYQLFRMYEVDYSIASATGLFDIEKLCWDEEALNLAGITTTHLSTAVDTGYSRTYLQTQAKSLLNLSPETVFIIGASDGCLANLGTLTIKPHTAAVTIGTSGALRIITEKPIRNYHAMIFSYLLDSKTYVCGGSINNGGTVLQWLVNNILNRELSDQNYDQVFKDIQTVTPGCDGLLFLPYLNGERAPVWDTQSSGTFVGIRAHHTQAHFLRAVLEGICFALKEVLNFTEQSSEVITQLHVSGGFVVSEIWMQLLADVTGKKLILVQTEDASAIGAAYLALKSLKLIHSYSDLKSHPLIEIIPNKEHTAIYNNYFLIYNQLYTNLKDTMHQLHQLSALS